MLPRPEEVRFAGRNYAGRDAESFLNLPFKIAAGNWNDAPAAPLASDARPAWQGLSSLTAILRRMRGRGRKSIYR